MPVFFGVFLGGGEGNQLTREWATGAQGAKLQTEDQVHQLQGVIPKVEDWHTLVIFYQVSYLP